MPPQIPGYYFDAEKNKYFKIEKSSTAPSTAAWSSDAVKKRKVEHKATQAVKRREGELRNHVKRSALGTGTGTGTGTDGGVTLGLWRRQLGRAEGAVAGGLAGGSSSLAVDGDVAASSWAQGLVDKECVKFSSGRTLSDHLPVLWVGGEEEGMSTGLVYTAPDHRATWGIHINTDADGRIEAHHPDRLPDHQSRGQRRYHLPTREIVDCLELSSIKYHAPSHRLLFTSRLVDSDCCMYDFEPPRMEDGSGDWMIGRTSTYTRRAMANPSRRDWGFNTCAPAPASSPDYLCALATTDGIARVRQHSSVTDTNGVASYTAPGELFDVTYCRGSGSGSDSHPDLLMAAGRQAKVWTADFRMKEEEWTYFRTPSSVARVWSLGQHGILVSGLRSSMGLYDTRFVKQSHAAAAVTGQRTKGARGAAVPLVKYTSHQNEAHVHIGFDVSEKLGVVAAAQDDGTVKLFSLKSGVRLLCPALEAMKMESPIKALMFKTAPGEKNPSLFIGEGSWVRKYSWGTLQPDDEA